MRAYRGLPMSLLFTLAKLAAALNAVLLLALGYVWLQNYRQLRSKQTLGLLLFAALLFAENAFALYYYLADPALSAWFGSQVPDVAWYAMLSFHGFEAVALVFLVWISYE